ncbi:MAG: DUF5666 domain-containing protein, partial [Dehalococcoidia bacterium]
DTLITRIRPFHVEPGQVTVVLLNFNGRSLLTTDQGGDYHVTPDVNVYTEEPAQHEKPSQETPPDSAPDTGLATDETGLVAPTDIDGPIAIVVVEGVIQKRDRNAIVVQGKPILLAPDVEVHGVLEVGRIVRVEVVVLEDHTFVARRIQVR